MAAIRLTVKFEPQKLRAYNRNEAVMNLAFENADGAKQYWCECEIEVKPPLSLAGDKELNAGRTRVGIVKPAESKSKQVKLYTRPNNFPDSYSVGITTFVYDDDGTIAERLEQTESIACEG
jgi:hypothetical protein